MASLYVLGFDFIFKVVPSRVPCRHEAAAALYIHLALIKYVHRAVVFRLLVRFGTLKMLWL